MSHFRSFSKWILRALIDVRRFLATEFLLRNAELSTIEKHLKKLENRIDEPIRNVLKNFLDVSSSFRLRFLVLIGDDDRLLSFALNSSNRLDFRCIALRTMTKIENFQENFQNLFDDETQPNEIRLIAFENLRSPNIDELSSRILSKQIRFYFESLEKKTSIWSRQSGRYEFPFGTIDVFFDEFQTSFWPNVVQIEIKKKFSIEFFRFNDEIFILINRKIIRRFSDLFDDLSIEFPTLDGFVLHIELEIERFNTNFRPWTQFFQIFSNEKANFHSIGGLTLKIHHGLDTIRTGFLLRFHLESNFRIEIQENVASTSFLWFANRKENTLFKVE